MIPAEMIQTSDGYHHGHVTAYLILFYKLEVKTHSLYLLNPFETVANEPSEAC